MSSRWWTLAALLGVACASSAEAGKAGNRLGEARAAAKRLELEHALQLARAGLEAGDATPDEAWTLHALLGELSAAMGFREAAVEAFSRALLLNPGYELPPEASPKLLVPYQEARTLIGGGRLSIVPKAVTGEDRRVRLTVRIEGDLLHLVNGGRAYTGEPGQVRFLPVPLARTDVLEGQWRCEVGPCPFFVALTDRQGNELLRSGSAKAPLYAEEPPWKPVAVLPEPAPSAERQWYARPGPYLAAAAGLSVVGSYFAYRFNDDQQRLLTVNDNRADFPYAEAQALDAARRRDQVAMFVSFGAAAAAGVTAIVLW